MQEVHQAPSLPASFTWTSDDPFYYGPSTCELLHNKPAAFVAGVVEFIVLLAGAVGFWQYNHTNHSVAQWALVAMFAVLVFSILTTGLLFIGLFLEQPNLMIPKIAFIRVWIILLMAIAFTSIAVMSVGLELTNHVFSYAVNVADMERDFGPLWPFNISAVAFFTAALSIWTRVLVTSARDYIIDKEYFSQKSEIEMEKTLPRPE